MVFGKSKEVNKEEAPKEGKERIAELEAGIVKSEQKLKELESPEEATEPEKVDENKPEEEKPEEVKEYVRVVKELPLQPVRQHIDEETGAITNFITIEEALTKIMGAI